MFATSLLGALHVYYQRLECPTKNENRRDARTNMLYWMTSAVYDCCCPFISHFKKFRSNITAECKPQIFNLIR